MSTLRQEPEPRSQCCDLSVLPLNGQRERIAVTLWSRALSSIDGVGKAAGGRGQGAPVSGGVPARLRRRRRDLPQQLRRRTCSRK